MGLKHLPMEDRDRAVVGLLRRAGDASLALRNVQHVARFEARVAAQRFADSLSGMGYHLELREASIHESGRGQWLVEFAAMQACDLSSVQRHTKTLQALTRKFSGEYLGWSTQPVRVRKPR